MENVTRIIFFASTVLTVAYAYAIACGLNIRFFLCFYICIGFSVSVVLGRVPMARVGMG